MPLKGPRGAISHFCMSRALQSLSSTRPKMASEAASGRRGVPSSLPVPITHACTHPRNAHQGSEDSAQTMQQEHVSRMAVQAAATSPNRDVSDKP